MEHCDHKLLRFDCPGSGDGSYQQPSADEIRAALQLTGPGKQRKASRKKAARDDYPPTDQTFPAPLVLQGDELYHDPKYPPQSVQDWVDEEARNEVTAERRTIYVVPPPEIAEEVDFMAGWTNPQKPPLPTKRKAAAAARVSESSSKSEEAAHAPQIEDVAEYLQAFYHGLPVKILENQRLRFARWEIGSKGKAKPQIARQVGLETENEAVRVRCRPSPDKSFKGQLNLNDLLDAAIDILPADAYALLMLVHQDLYEDEDDDFCCGRAYGGSRVAVVSTARYQPGLDARQNVNREHSWPASHCRVSFGWLAKVGWSPQVRDKTMSERYPGSALAAGVGAFNALPSPTATPELSAVWLGRVCKTASHELGHCFGIDHCTYYACVMQGTANMAEDSRQPPYLCPVDLAKVLQAGGAEESERYHALLSFCERRSDDRTFAAFAAWLRVRMERGNTG